MTDTTPTCCELACYEDPGCACDGCLLDALREALNALDLRCENYTEMYRSDFDLCERNGRPRGGNYGVDRWCLPCEIRAALAGDSR